MSANILSIGTAVPPHFISQEEALKVVLSFSTFDSTEQDQIKKLYQNSGIAKRHLVTPELKKERSEWNFWGNNYPVSVPGMTQRNDLYKDVAPKLAHQAAEKAIDHWGGDRSALTHIIFISCTGVVAPGIEFMLLNSLGLQKSIHRLGINFMGCFGAFKGLEVAHAFAKTNPENRILVVCTELCSLHMQAKTNQDNLVGASLFADGAAAVIIGLNPKENEKPMWEIIQHQSHGLENSSNDMTWEASDTGFLMRLSSTVPVVIARHIKKFAHELTKEHLDVKDCDWAIHPGGKSILTVIEKKLHLDRTHTEASWEIYKNYGNMSSATFLFVLEALKNQKATRSWAAGVGFGPGLSMEGVLLKKI